MMENLVRQFNEHVKTSDLDVNFRDIFASELFGLAMKQVSVSLNKIKLTFSENRIVRFETFHFLSDNYLVSIDSLVVMVI